jgi:hypothetical protein
MDISSAGRPMDILQVEDNPARAHSFKLLHPLPTQPAAHGDP